MNAVNSVHVCVTKRGMEITERWITFIDIKNQTDEAFSIKAFLFTYAFLVLSMTGAILSRNCRFSALFLQYIGSRNMVLKV